MYAVEEGSRCRVRRCRASYSHTSEQQGGQSSQSSSSARPSTPSVLSSDRASAAVPISYAPTSGPGPFMHHMFGDAIPPATSRPLVKDLPKRPPKRARVDSSDDDEEEGKEDDAFLAEVATMFDGQDQQGAGVGDSFFVEIILIMWSLRIVVTLSHCHSWSSPQSVLFLCSPLNALRSCAVLRPRVGRRTHF